MEGIKALHWYEIFNITKICSIWNVIFFKQALIGNSAVQLWMVLLRLFLKIVTSILYHKEIAKHTIKDLENRDRNMM